MFHAVSNGKFEKIDRQKFSKNLNRLDVINISGNLFTTTSDAPVRLVSPDKIDSKIKILCISQFWEGLTENEKVPFVVRNTAITGVEINETLYEI